MKSLFISISFVFLISSAYCQKKPKYSTTLSKEKGTELLRQCSRSVPKGISSFFDLNQRDIQLLESKFNKLHKIKSSGCCSSGRNIKELNKTAFQYVGVIINDKKFIYINAFYIENGDELTKYFRDWKTAPVIICDGGEYEWGALFSLDTLEFSQLSMNGFG